jgi:hypothetical protein
MRREVDDKRAYLTLLGRAGRTSLWRKLNIEATCPTSSNSIHANTQALADVHLAISISFLVHQSRVSRWECLCSVADDLEDINGKAVGCIVKLLVESLTHILLLNGFVDQGRDNGLRGPVGKTMHNSGKLFVGIDGSLASILVLEGSIGVYCGFCSRGSVIY